MKNDKADQYGSVDWFINEYNKVDDDPWGLSWRSSQKVRYARILRLLDTIESPPSSVLDVGCATGDFTNLLKSKYGQKSSVIGIDFIENAINRAKGKYPKINFRVGSIFDVGRDYEGLMDLVTCLEVLYYFERKECPWALASVKESLRPGGYALFSSLIAKPPHFSLNELEDLVSTEFKVILSQTVHVKLLSIGERIIMKLEKLGKQKIGLPHDMNIARNILELTPFRAADLIEKCSCTIGAFSASHAHVLCRRF